MTEPPARRVRRTALLRGAGRPFDGAQGSLGSDPALGPPAHRPPVWLFDLDDTLHDASHAAFAETGAAMSAYMCEVLGLEPDEATRLRRHYWRRYGATLLGLIRHHGVEAAHFLEATHRHPELETRLRTSRHDIAAVARLPGRRYVLTNAPRAYTERVLKRLRLGRLFDGVLTIEDMTMFGHLRPKPDARMFRHLAARLGVRPVDCVLVEDTLANQRTAHAVGLRTAWLQRYLGGRFRGHLRGGATHGSSLAPRVVAGPVRRCPAPMYVDAKIRALSSLRSLFRCRSSTPSVRRTPSASRWPSTRRPSRRPTRSSS